MYQLGRKRKDYARAGVSYYAVYDRTAGVASPLRQLRELQGSPLALFQRRGGEFVPFESTWLEDIGLGLTLWQGSFEGVNTEWLRWCDREGQVLPTGEEKAALEQQRAEAERQRAGALLELLRSHGKGLRPANAKGLRPANAKGLRPANAIAPPAA